MNQNSGQIDQNSGQTEQNSGQNLQKTQVFGKPRHMPNSEKLTKNKPDYIFIFQLILRTTEQMTGSYMTLC